jgi:hypothetical protein
MLRLSKKVSSQRVHTDRQPEKRTVLEITPLRVFNRHIERQLDRRTKGMYKKMQCLLREFSQTDTNNSQKCATACK